MHVFAGGRPEKTISLICHSVRAAASTQLGLHDYYSRSFFTIQVLETFRFRLSIPLPVIVLVIFVKQLMNIFVVALAGWQVAGLQAAAIPAASQHAGYTVLPPVTPFPVIDNI